MNPIDRPLMDGRFPTGALTLIGIAKPNGEDPIVLVLVNEDGVFAAPERMSDIGCPRAEILLIGGDTRGDDNDDWGCIPPQSASSAKSPFFHLYKEYIH